MAKIIMSERDVKIFWSGLWENLSEYEWTKDTIKDTVGTDDEDYLGDYRSDYNEAFEDFEDGIEEIFSSEKALKFAKFTVRKFNEKLDELEELDSDKEFQKIENYKPKSWDNEYVDDSILEYLGLENPVSLGYVEKIDRFEDTTDIFYYRLNDWVIDNIIEKSKEYKSFCDFVNDKFKYILDDWNPSWVIRRDEEMSIPRPGGL